MVSTSKENGKRPPEAAKTTKAPEPIGDGWDEAPSAVSTGSDGPVWCPQWAELMPEARQRRLEGKPEGSHSNLVVIGQLKIEKAFGEDRYFVEEKGILLAMPNHDVLTGAFDKFPDPTKQAVTVRVAFIGDSVRAKEGQQAAKLYDVRAKGADGKPLVAGAKAREGALLPVHHANKAAREAAKAAAAKAKGKAVKAKGADAPADEESTFQTE